jgi:hypothetical protein
MLRPTDADHDSAWTLNLLPVKGNTKKGLKDQCEPSARGSHLATLR